MERNDPSTVKEADSIQINIKGVSGKPKSATCAT